MIRWVTAPARIGLVVAAIAASVPMIAFAQTSNLAIEGVPTEAEAEEVHADPTGGQDGTGDDTSAQAGPSFMSAIPPEVEVDIQRRFNELRSELLDDRASTVDWWLAFMAVVLGFFALVVVLGGYIAFTRFREIEAEAKDSVEISKGQAAEAMKLVGKIEENRDKSEKILQDQTAKTAADNPDEADQAVESVLKNPEASRIQQAIGRALSLQRLGKRDEAIEKWRAVATVAEGGDNDLAARAWFSVGYLIQDEDLEGSIFAYDRAIRLNPDYVEAYINRGNTQHKLGQYEAAIDDYDEAIRLNPASAQAYNNRGAVKGSLGQYEAAIDDYDEAIRLNPDDAEAYSNRGNTKYKLGQNEAAIADCNEAILLNPDHVDAYINRGSAKGSLGQQEEAIADYDEAIRLNPASAQAYNNRGAVKGSLGQYEAAIADLDEAIRLNPASAQAYNNRGAAKGSLGQQEEAIADYDEAIRLKPAFAGTYLNRGNATAAVKRKDEARKDFENALELARKANNAKIMAKAEQALRDLDDAEES